LVQRSDEKAGLLERDAIRLPKISAKRRRRTATAALKMVFGKLAGCRTLAALGHQVIVANATPTGLSMEAATVKR
jgi:hypothetical protein